MLKVQFCPAVTVPGYSGPPVIIKDRGFDEEDKSFLYVPEQAGSPRPISQNCQMEQPMIHSWQQAQGYYTKDPMWFEYKEKKKKEEEETLYFPALLSELPANLSDQRWAVSFVFSCSGIDGQTEPTLTSRWKDLGLNYWFSYLELTDLGQALSLS